MRLVGSNHSQLFSVICLAFLSACSWSKKEAELGAGEVIRAQIPVYKNGEYHLDVIELNTLTSLTEFKGSSARFLVKPSVNKQGKLAGETPNFRYLRDQDGVIVALDQESLQMITVYAHFEKLRNLDEIVGAKDVLTYPRTVTMNARFSTGGDLTENNAVYSSQYDALLAAPFTEQSLPLMANAGVIGHEHFHALFQKLVIEPLGEKYPNPGITTLHPEASGQLSRGRERRQMSPRDRYHMVLIRGINEGFADVWGWIYSGDNSFFRRSLPNENEKMNRELEVIPEFLFRKDDLLGPVLRGEPDDTLLFRAYSHGIQLARTLRNFAILNSRSRNLSEQKTREELGVLIKNSLPELAKYFLTLKENEYLTLAKAITLVVDQQKNLHSKECLFVAKLMPSDELSKESLKSRCQEIEKLETKP